MGVPSRRVCKHSDIGQINPGLRIVKKSSQITERARFVSSLLGWGLVGEVFTGVCDD